jgi:SHS2 domain-containing protein
MAAESARLTIGRIAGLGFQEIPHQADCALSVWAPDLKSLFIEAALGLNHISGASIQNTARTSRQIMLRAADDEGLLVQFLSELIYFQESENLAFDGFNLDVEPGTLKGVLWGAPLIRRGRLVKAATFHNLRIRSHSGSLMTEIVFDV